MLAVLLLAAWLRFNAVTRDVRFHPDEALFATFARAAAVHGEWMLTGPLDKPPLSLYAAALSMQFTGVYVNDQGVLDLDLRRGEFSARLPNVFAGLVITALVFALGQRLYDAQTGLAAALLAGLSPYLVSFSATAFTDMLMLAWMVAALLAAVRGRGGWSGLLLALSVASKQQGALYLPLVLALLVMGGGGAARRAVGWFAAAFAGGILLLLLWDMARGETSIFALAAANNNPERFLVRPDEILPRLQTWLSYGAGMFGAAGALVLLVRPGGRSGRLLAGYCAAYMLAHWLIALNTYDRYLLPLLPLLALLLARGLVFRVQRLRTRLPGGARRANALALGTLAGVMLLSQATYPTDTRPRDDQIIALADLLNAKSLGTIIYDYWLGWEMGYYLGPWSDKRRVYYPAPEVQAADALCNPDPAPRYLIAPAQAHAAPWLNALSQRGFSVSAVIAPPRYRMYEVIPAWADASDAGSSWQGLASHCGVSP